MHEKFTKTALLAPALVTASANATGVDISSFTGEGIFQAIGCIVSGTSPTLGLTLEHSHDNSTYVAITGGAFTSIATGAASSEAIVLKVDDLRKYVRVAKTIGGSSTPTVAAGVVLHAAPKYQS